MAELGAISGAFGIVSVAIQVADNILKLKNFLDSVKEAPQEIRYLLGQIEALSLVLSGCDNEDDPVSAGRKTCKVFLIRAAESLEIIVKDLEMEMEKRKRMGRFKAVLKQKMVDRLKQRLHDAQVLLALSNQYYLQALQKRQHDMQQQWAEIQAHRLTNLEICVAQCREAVQSVSSSSTTSSWPTLQPHALDADESCSTDTASAWSKKDCKELARNYRKVTSSLKYQKKVLARLRSPSWLRFSSLCFEICGQRSLYTMSLNVKVYRIVPYDSPLVEYAQNGNLAAIQEMISNGTATPNDMIGYHSLEPILVTAAEASQVEVCRFLIQQGAQNDASDAYIRVLNFGNPLQDAQKRLDLIRTLAEAVGDDDFFEFHPTKSSLIAFRGEPSILSWILHNVIGYTYQMSKMEDRAEIAIHLCARVRQPRAAALVRFLLPESQAIMNTCHYMDSRGRTLLNSTAWALGEQALRAIQSSRISQQNNRVQATSASDDPKYDPQAETDCLQDLLTLMKELVQARSNLHGCAYRFRRHPQNFPGETPLSAIFSSSIHLANICAIDKYLYLTYGIITADGLLALPPPAVTDVLVPVVMWLDLLYEAGIDLIDYGRREQELHRSGQTRRQYWVPAHFHDDELRAEYFSVSFIYGPKPNDWRFWLIEQMDDSVAEFWVMVDHPERAMPGAWDERFDDEY